MIFLCSDSFFLHFSIRSLVYVYVLFKKERKSHLGNFYVFQLIFQHRKHSSLKTIIFSDFLNCILPIQTFLNNITVFLNQSESLIYNIAKNSSSKGNRFSFFQSAFCPFLARKFKVFKQNDNVFKSLKMSHLQHCNNSSSKRKRLSHFPKCILPIFGAKIQTF